MNRIYVIILFAALQLAASCSGYHFKTSKNPFSSYGIRSIAVPMFLNHTPIPNVAGHATKEIFLLLSKFPELRVYSGENKLADAVLVGILSSGRKKEDVYSTGGSKLTEDNEITNRQVGEKRGSFFIPTSTSYNLKLKLVLIKNPSIQDRELIKNDQLSQYLDQHPRILINTALNFDGSFSRAIDYGAVNFTNTKANQDKSIKETAKKVANTFEQVVIHAF